MKLIRKQIGEGLYSVAYMDESSKVLLKGKRKDSLSIYNDLKSNMDLLEGKISINIPTGLNVIGCCKKFPFGAMTYKGVLGKEIEPQKLSVQERENIGGELAKFIDELHGLDIVWSRDFTMRHEAEKVKRNAFLLHEYLSVKENGDLASLIGQFILFLEKSEFCITHGDLQHENILVDDNQLLVGIIDFGNMAFAPKEFDLCAIYDLDKIIYNSTISKYKKNINNKDVMLCLLFRQVAFFEYVQAWSDEAKMKEVALVKRLICECLDANNHAANTF